MGRHCGDIAVHTAVACGAEMAIIPEVPWTLEEVADTVHKGVISGKRSMILIFAEGAQDSLKTDLKALKKEYPKLHITREHMTSSQYAEVIEELSGHETRATVLGYTQRGGSPTANDRILATRTGAHAVELLKNNIGGRAVGIKGNKIMDVSLDEALSPMVFDREYYDLVDLTGYVR